MLTEHILLESDDREVPAPQSARKIHAQVKVRSRLRRSVLQLEIIDYYYLAVRSRAGSTELEYVVDLRFAVAPPRFSRHIAGRWLTASLLLMVLAIGTAAGIHFSATPAWHHAWLSLGAAVTGMWALTTLVAAYRTTETVHLLSRHGGARLLEYTGGVGTLRALRHFLAKLAAHIQLASAARRRTKAEHLRDEMREHSRLREIGVLSAEEYEASKVRILAQHAPDEKARPRPSRTQ